jgi:hypothetical protein
MRFGLDPRAYYDSVADRLLLLQIFIWNFERSLELVNKRGERDRHHRDLDHKPLTARQRCQYSYSSCIIRLNSRQIREDSLTRVS